MLIPYLKRTNFYAFLRAFNKGFGQYKFKIALLAAAGFASALLEGIGINAFIPIFAFITGSGNRGDDAISKALASVFDYFHIEYRLKYLLILVVVLFLAKTAAAIIGDYLSIRITADFTEKTRRQVFTNTVKAGWPYLIKEQLGHLNTLILTNVGYCELLLNNFGGLIVVVAGLIMYCLVAINISLPITVFTILAGFIFLIAVKPLLARTRRVSKQAEGVNRNTAHHINENLLGMKTIKAMAVDDWVVDQGYSYFKVLRIYNIKAFLLKLIPPSFMQPAALLFVMFIFAFAYHTPNFNIAAMAAVVYLIQQIFLYVQKLQRHIHVINDSYPYFKTIQNFSEQAKAAREENNGTKPFSFTSELRFEHVFFGYDESKNVMSDISFTIGQGSMVGLIGPSGAGKTTLVDLLLRLFRPQKGVITVDGISADEVELKSWRREIGYVPQDIFLINDTVRNNIKFYDDSITDQAVEKAAREAYIDDFVSTLPQGYETIIGERGITLSQGQRQRIVIARVLARQPKILVLDEATSALDNESESKIQKVIEDLRGKLTVIVIAHRLSTIMNTDKIIAIEAGRVLEEGSPQDLLKNKDSYFYRVSNLNQ